MLALIAASAAAVLTALILGEYVLTFWTATAAGLVVGCVLAEIVLGVTPWRGPVPALVVAALGGGALAWAGWIEAGRGVAPVRSTMWIGVVLAAVVGAARLWPVARRQRRSGSSP
jgi:hypothetical protein